MILSLSTMWAQQERFVNDMHEFVHEARRLGYDAIEVSHATPRVPFDRLLEFHQVPISSIHAPAPLVRDATDRANSSLNLAALDDDERLDAINFTRASIDYTKEVGGKYVVIHLGGIGNRMFEAERELRQLYDSGTREGGRVDELREEYAEIKGLSVGDIEDLADEFTSHGKKASTEIYRGVAQHTNGFYTVQAINTLNILIGNADWKGGLADGGGSWNDLGQKGQPFVFADLHPGKTKAFGVTMTREGWKYEDSTLFERDGGYPATRPWYPFASEMYQDVIPAAAAGYPYPARVLWLHMGTPAYSVPAGKEQIAMLRDPKVIPLFIATDLVIGDTSMYADYLFPDLSYLERWASPGDVPQPAAKSNPFRQPAAAPIPETVTVFGEDMPISMEAAMLALAEKLQLSGFGEGAFADGVSLKRPEDYYLKIAANLAFGDKEDGSEVIPDADATEVQLFLDSRRHLPPTVFDEAKWKAAVGENMWPKVIYVLNRGGRFEHLGAVYDGDHMKHRFGGAFHIFVERTAKQKDSVTGKNYDGFARYDPPLFANGNEVGDEDFEFQLITHKEAFGTNGRTSQLYWAQDAIRPENFVLLNQRDAESLGLDDDDEVMLVSASLSDGAFDVAEGRRRDVSGKVKRVQGLRPGVVVVSHHYGHWAYGSDDVEIDGEKIKGDDRRSTGLNPNPAMRLDEHTRTACLTDPIGGSASFYDTKVNVVKV